MGAGQCRYGLIVCGAGRSGLYYGCRNVFPSPCMHSKLHSLCTVGLSSFGHCCRGCTGKTDGERLLARDCGRSYSYFISVFIMTVNSLVTKLEPCWCYSARMLKAGTGGRRASVLRLVSSRALRNQTTLPPYL